MAEQIVHDVVDQSQSVGDISPSDALATNNNQQASGGEGVEDAGALEGRGISQEWRSAAGFEGEYSHLDGREVINGLSDKLKITQGRPYSPLSSGVPPSLSDDGHLTADLGGNADNISISDTDTSRADGSAAEDGKSHETPNTVKKTTSFKPVSFAKSKFSTSKGPGVATGVRTTTDKGAISSTSSLSASMQPLSRPRLVAKSTSGLGNSASKSKSTSKNGSIPDPMQVWNKNRVTPQPSTKHLTDEELKQQYGIHMTSRIQADGEGKEAKWADIDDDEDDWAPETIEWGDGTKVTVNQADTLAPPSQTSIEEAAPVDGEKPAPTKILSSLVSSSVGPNATILKVGANAQRQEAQKAAITQKGPTEKSNQSGSKNPAPVPSKSPWAVLPPIDKVSPVAINPQMAAPPTTRYFSHQGNAQSPSTMTSSSPAKEISADDFNRSWRDSHSSQPPSLYMPNSGRYEAVNENRRRGSRNDQSFRAPAVLQRPSQSEHPGPAEPSPAFQTNRVSTDSDRGTWGRRRASSNLSGTSGQFGRRMSITKPGDSTNGPNDVLEQRRGSHNTGNDSIDSSQDMPPPQLPSSAYRVRGNSPVYAVPRHPSFAAEQGPNIGSSLPDSIDIEAEKVRQKQLMREKRELAIKRRKEEEERMEAEKRERIRLKLEAMGPPPEKNKSQEVISDNVEKTGQTIELPMSSPLQSRPPIPFASNEPKQYGMMTLHPPESSVKMASSPEPQTEASTAKPTANDISNSIIPDSVKVTPAVINGFRSNPDSQTEKSPENAPAVERNVPSTKGNGIATEPRAGWASSRLDHRTPTTASLWGPPTNNKALGNGTFDQSLAGFSSREFGPRDSSWLNGRPLQPEKSPQLASASTHVPMERDPSTPSFPPSEQSPLAANSEIDSLYPHSIPAPIGPPQLHQTGSRWQASSDVRPANTGIAAWNDFQNTSAREDRAENERLQRERAIRLEEEAKTGIRRQPQYTFNETWKQVEVGDQAGQRQITGVAQTNFVPPVTSAGQFGAVGSLPAADPSIRAPNGVPGRGSRFFPQIAETGPLQTRRAVTYSHPEVSRTPSPPSAEEYASGHPAFDGDINRPVVQLPPQKPVVKLPPAMKPVLPSSPPPTAVPRSFAAALSSQAPPPPQIQPLPPPPQRTISTPIASTPSWQARINSLLGSKAGPEIKNQALAVASSTRESLEVVPVPIAASVSLPQKEDSMLKDAGKVTSKDVEDEEEMFEDREAGSLPMVKIPQKAPSAAWHPARTPLSRPKSRFFQQDEPFTVKPYMLEFFDEYSHRKQLEKRFAYIRLPGASKAVKRELHVRKSTPASSKGSRNSSAAFSNSKPRKAMPKSRESSSTQPQSRSSGKNSSHRQSPVPNGAVSPPNTSMPHHNSFRGNRQQSGMAH